MKTIDLSEQKLQTLRTLLHKSLDVEESSEYSPDYKKQVESYYEGYKDAIEGIYEHINGIKDIRANSIKGILEYLINN